MRHLLPLALVSSVLLVCGCGGSGDKDGTAAPSSSESSAAANGKKKTFRIAVIPKGTSHDFWLSVRHGAETAAKELGNVEVVWKGTQHEGDKDGQIQILDGFIVSGVDGICLAPIDRRHFDLKFSKSSFDRFPKLLVEAERSMKRLLHRGTRLVVFGRTETSRHHADVRTGGRKF